MYSTRCRPTQFVLLVGAVALVATLVYRRLQGAAEQKRIVEQSEAKALNATLAKLSPHILSPHWNFRPKFTDTADPAVKRRPRIPHIIHQVWDTTQVPDRYVKWMKTWKKLHSTWEYWFWTLDDVRRLVAKHYPDHLVLYDSYHQPIFRADAMRYFVIHRFGGIYVDLDMEALKPMDDWTFHYNCVVSEECYEHSFVVREQPTSNVLNGFIACEPNHPLLKLAIESLGESARRDFGDPLHATGPYFFDAVLKQYQAGSTNSASITVVPPRYFFPTYDESESDTISGKCYPSKLRKLPANAQMVCKELLRRSFKNTRSSDAYTDHYWVHAYMFGDDWKNANTIRVSAIEPEVILPGKRF